MTRRTAAAACLVVLIATASASHAQLISNDVKYRDSSVPHATGRAGDASVEARALLGSDETTTIEIAANGAIERVQLKLAGGAAQNFNGVDAPTFDTAVTGLLHGHPLQLQVNVQSADAGRIGVVTVDDRVRYRPDLQVGSILAPDFGVVGAPTLISATIHERLGDTGARADCVLLADGVEVDRAASIWVDAGGTVSCRFAPAFASAGPKQLTVVARAVTPGDYDDANNSASGSVTIYERVDGFSRWSLRARETNLLYRRTFDSEVLKTTYEEEGWTQAVQLDAFLPFYPDLESLDVSFTELTDGAVMNDQRHVEWGFHSTSCIFSTEGWYGVTGGVEICNFPGWFGPQYFQLTIGRYAGAVTYRSNVWSVYFYDGASYVYSWNTENHVPEGLQHRLGNDYRMRVSMTDGATLWQFDESVTFEEFSYDESSPRQCGWDPYYGNYCGRTIDRGTVKFGSAAR